MSNDNFNPYGEASVAPRSQTSDGGAEFSESGSSQQPIEMPISLKVASIFMVILGVFGLLGILSTAFGLRVQMLTPTPTGPGADMQLRIQESIANLQVANIVFTIVNTILGGVLVAAAICGFRGSSKAVRLTLVVLVLGTLIESGRIILTYLSTMAMQNVMETVSPDPNGPDLSGFMSIIMIISLVFAVVWAVIKGALYFWFAWAARTPKAKEYYAFKAR